MESLMLACQAEKKCVLKCCESMLNLLKLSHTHLKDSMATADAGDPPTGSFLDFQ